MTFVQSRKRSAYEAGLEDWDDTGCKMQRTDECTVFYSSRMPPAPEMVQGTRKRMRCDDDGRMERKRPRRKIGARRPLRREDFDVAASALHFVYQTYQYVNAELTEMEMLRRTRRHDDYDDHDAASAACSDYMMICVN